MAMPSARAIRSNLHSAALHYNFHYYPYRNYPSGSRPYSQSIPVSPLSISHTFHTINTLCWVRHKVGHIAHNYPSMLGLSKNWSSSMTSIRNIYSVNMIGHLYNLLPSAKHEIFHMPADHALSPFPPSPSLLTGIVPQRPLRYFQRMSTPNLFCATHKHTMLVSTLPLPMVGHILAQKRFEASATR